MRITETTSTTKIAAACAEYESIAVRKVSVSMCPP